MSISDDPDMENALAALVRAGNRARRIALQTGTAIIVVRDGKVVREIPQAQPEDLTAKPLDVK